jgi:hypothetical protein
VPQLIRRLTINAHRRDGSNPTDAVLAGGAPWPDSRECELEHAQSSASVVTSVSTWLKGKVRWALS